jgi:hypothetical protein
VGYYDPGEASEGRGSAWRRVWISRACL